MAIFTADLNNELDQLTTALGTFVEKNLIPSTKELVHKEIKPALSDVVTKDIKPAATELLIETRYHSAWLIKEAGAETQALVNLVDEKVTKSIELVETKVSKQLAQIDDLLTKHSDKLDISLCNKLHHIEGILNENINEINDCIGAHASVFHKELRKTILFASLCGAGLLVVAALLYRYSFL